MVILQMCPGQVRGPAFDGRDKPTINLSESPAPRLSPRLCVAIDSRREAPAEFEDAPALF